jgi:hypothetical protein
MKNEKSPKPEHDEDCKKNHEYRRLSHMRLTPSCEVENRIPSICGLVFMEGIYPAIAKVPICGTLDSTRDFT